MKYVLVSVKDGRLVPKAVARKTVVLLIVTGPEYNVEVVVGSLPSVVYLIVAVASDQVILTVCVAGYNPA